MMTFRIFFQRGRRMKSAVALGLLLAGGLGAGLAPAGMALAAPQVTCPDGSVAFGGDISNCPGGAGGTTNTGSTSAVTPKDYVCIGLPVLPGLSKCSPQEGGGLKLSNNKAQGGAIVVYLRDLLKLLSSAVGGVIVLMIVIAGIQYITSTADPSRVKAAKDRLQNAIIALVLFLSMFAILTFIIPGGIL
jgi:hypothetical protein